MQEIKIPLSKTKITLLLVGSMLFVFSGILAATDPSRFVSNRYSENTVLFAGVAAIVFFGLCSFFIAKKVFSKTLGLEINEKGIIDNSGAASVGLIEWDDIAGYSKIEIASSKILMIHTSNPEKYIGRATNFIAKKAMTANHKMYGSPLSITANSLKIKFADLERLLAEQIEKRIK